MDTVEKATFVSLDVANRRIDNFEELADFTYIAHFTWNPEIIHSMYLQMP